jgi:hypothetical protein
VKILLLFALIGTITMLSHIAGPAAPGDRSAA